MATSVPITTSAVTVADNGSTVDVAVTQSAVSLNVGTVGPQGATGPAPAWGNITGTLGDQTDLAGELAGKAATVGLWLSGTAGNFVSCPDVAAFSTTDLDVRIRVRLTDWTPAANQTVFSQGESASNFRFDCRVLTGSAFNLRFSADGTTLVSKSSTAASNLTDGVTYWIRYVLDVDNGAGGYDVKFYYAADSVTEPTSWTQLGTTVTTATATSLFDSTTDLRVGGLGTATQPAVGVFYRAVMKGGIDGASVADLDLTNGVGPRIRDSLNNLWTINGTANGWQA